MQVWHRCVSCSVLFSTEFEEHDPPMKSVKCQCGKSNYILPETRKNEPQKIVVILGNGMKPQVYGPPNLEVFLFDYSDTDRSTRTYRHLTQPIEEMPGDVRATVLGETDWSAVSEVLLLC